MKQLGKTWPASEIASLRRDVEALKRRAIPPATAGGTNLPYGMARRDSLAVVSGSSFTIVDYATGTNVQIATSGEGDVSVAVDGGGHHNLNLNTAGLYMLSWHASGSTHSSPAAGAVTDLRCDFDTGVGDYLAGGGYGEFLLDPGGVTWSTEVGVHMLFNLDSGIFTLPNTGLLKLRQNSGASVTYSAFISAVLISTITSSTFS